MHFFPSFRLTRIVSVDSMLALFAVCMLCMSFLCSINLFETDNARVRTPYESFHRPFQRTPNDSTLLFGKQIGFFEDFDIYSFMFTYITYLWPRHRYPRRRLSTLRDSKTESTKKEQEQEQDPTRLLLEETSIAFDSTQEHHVPDELSGPNVPSFIRLCKELLTRSNSMDVSTQYVVHEVKEVCYSQDSFQALTTMALSSIIANAGSLLRLSYEHNCPPPNDIKTATIQQLLPSTLSIAQGIGIDTAIHRCSRCLTTDVDARHMLECFGFPVVGPMSSDPLAAAQMLPAIRHNIDAAVHTTNRLEAESRSTTNAGVVLYLDTDSESGVDVYVVSMRYYAEIIPRDISSICILVSARCSNCNELSAFTKEYLHLLYPTANVFIEVATGSAVAYARVMETPLCICLPSLFCVLPSLFRSQSRITHIILHPHLYPWLKSLTDHIGGYLPKSLFVSESPSVSRLTNSPDMEAFLLQQADPVSSACIHLRGRLGHWIQDLEYAKSAQYVTPLKRFQKFNFTPTPEMPYRDATSYKWVDLLCPVFTVEIFELCHALQNLGLTRIHVVGDSLGMQMAQSLWKLLGNNDDPYASKAERFHWVRKVDCPGSSHSFELVYTRNDLLNNNDEKNLHLKIGLTGFNCGVAEFCLPWVRDFAEYTNGGTILITNIGTHVHDIDIFRDYLDSFFHLLDTARKPGDIVFVRTTPPGHEHCQNPHVAPLRNYDDYLEKHYIADFKSYHLFPTYNMLLEERVRDRFGTGVFVLDVVPMTVLRPDGHTSGPQKCSSCKSDDCLHYMLPGPTDWWNHLMYSNLMSVATT